MELPSGMRPQSIEEINRLKAVKSHEKRRYYKHDSVVVDMGPEYQARLKELRERSKELNKLLQKKFKEEHLPYSTRKTHSEAAKLTFQFRPPFTSSEEDKNGTRYTGASDEITLFLHITPENKLDVIRTWSTDTYYATALTADIDPDFNTNTSESKKDLKENFANYSLDTLCDYIISQLRESPLTKSFSEAYNIENEQQAEEYLTQPIIQSTPKGITQNLVNITLRSLLSHFVNSLPRNKDFKEVEQEITDKLDKMLQIKASYRREEATIKDVLDDQAAGNTFEDSKRKEKTYKSMLLNVIKDFKDEYKRKQFK